MLSSRHSPTIDNFSIKEMILHMVVNKSLFAPQDLLLDPNNPLSDPQEYRYYSEINSGIRFQAVKEKDSVRT